MKKPYLKIIGLIVIALTAGLIFTSLENSKKFKFQKTAEVQHSELVKGNHLISPDKAKDILSKQSDEYIFVDIRNPREFDNFHIEGAVNVPLQRVLDDEFIPYLKDERKKVLYSNEGIKANEIRLLLTQYGYDNLFVLQGGANYWKENMLSKDVFKSKGEYNDNKLKFDPNKLKASK
ncbi:MAG: rhodanese-like domain-containing protein [Cyclobacteriaceae bacterium]|nr:rhodanese-like domain-containing protein [Cyclobacteriaceae bacterium]